MLSIFLLGHTRGLGKEIFYYYSNKEDVEIIGESRKTGFDISKIDGRKRVVESCRDSDVIVLNAHDSFFQIEMLFDLFKKYREIDKKIIVLGSLSYEGIKDFPHPYAVQKKALRETCLQLQNCHSNLGITLLNPGWISTDRTESISGEDKLEIGTVCQIMDLVIYMQKRVLFRELSFSAKEEFSKEKILPSPFEKTT